MGPQGTSDAGGAVLQVDVGQVTAFRLTAQHLGERLAADRLLDAAAACGVQNSPPGSALLAVHARVDGVGPQAMDRAAVEEKSLLQTWSLRGAPFFLPTRDVATFTTGVLPATEPARRHLILGVEPALARLGMGLDEAVRLTEAEIRAVLSGRQLAINELGAELAARVAPGLPIRVREVWQSAGPYAAGQPLGEAVVHFCLRILTLLSVVCFGARTRNTAPFVLVDEWLPAPPPPADPQAARAELLRRYLRCYGPSRRQDFAAWLGVRTADTDPWWSLLAEELTPVPFRRPTWILTEDVDALRSAPSPRGLRLLPPHDPYTQARDPETIVPKERHRQVWKPVGDPGTLLVDGRIAGVWRPRTTGRRLSITVTPFARLTGPQRALLDDEAEHLARLRGATSVEVRIADGDA